MITQSLGLQEMEKIKGKSLFKEKVALKVSQCLDKNGEINWGKEEQVSKMRGAGESKRKKKRLFIPNNNS